MRFLDSTTVIVNDSIIKAKDSLKVSIPVNYNNQKITENSTKITLAVKDSSNTNLRKDSSNIYLHEPWESILSVNNQTFKQTLKSENIFCGSNNDSYKIANRTNNVIHVEELFFPASTFVLTTLLFALFLLSLAKVTYRKYMKQFMNAIINYSEATKLYEDRNIMIDRLFFVMNLVFIVSGGLFINFFVSRVDPNLTSKHPYIALSICFSVIILLYFYKFVFGKVLGFILLKVQVFNEYLYSSFLYYKIIGIFLLPVCFMLYIVSNEYKMGILIGSLIVISLLLILSVFRATRIILQKDILLFYWILYLCTIEFLPAILLYKFLSSYS